MGKTSWGVTLTPLILAIVQVLYNVATGNQITPEQTKVIVGLIAAFIGSGLAGAHVAAQKAKAGIKA